jgi:predicted dehydrogenase
VKGMDKVSVIMIGAGNRGYEAYGRIILKRPDIKVVAVAEPNDIRRERFAREHNIPKEFQFKSWEEVFEREKFADGVIITTMDRMHVAPAKSAIKKGYKVLLEKPIGVNMDEIKDLYREAKKYNASITVAHVLRYTPFFQKLRELLIKKAIGDLVGINLVENIGFFHFAHSFVRGNWRNSNTSAPSILAKSCHDLDILIFLVRGKVKYLSSYGELVHFRKEKAPSGATERCLDCKLDCPYDAKKIYLGDYTGWPVSVISEDLSLEGRLKALREGPYGRCVYFSDNNVVDHQVVSLKFENSIYATFTMSAFTEKITRKINVYGTHGEIYGDLDENIIEVKYFGKGEERINLNLPFKDMVGHGGGDEGIIDEFVKALKGEVKDTLSNIEESIESHLMAFSAEEARLNNKIVDMDQVRKNFYEL